MKNVEVKRGVSYSYDIGIEMLVNIIFGSKFVSIRLAQRCEVKYDLPTWNRLNISSTGFEKHFQNHDKSHTVCAY